MDFAHPIRLTIVLDNRFCINNFSIDKHTRSRESQNDHYSVMFMLRRGEWDGLIANFGPIDISWQPFKNQINIILAVYTHAPSRQVVLTGVSMHVFDHQLYYFI